VEDHSYLVKKGKEKCFIKGSRESSIAAREKVVMGTARKIVMAIYLLNMVASNFYRACMNDIL